MICDVRSRKILGQRQIKPGCIFQNQAADIFGIVDPFHLDIITLFGIGNINPHINACGGRNIQLQCLICRRADPIGIAVHTGFVGGFHICRHNNIGQAHLNTANHLAGDLFFQIQLRILHDIFVQGAVYFLKSSVGTKT